MITGAIKNKVDKIWTDLWAGGVVNPLRTSASRKRKRTAGTTGEEMRSVAL